ncbi:MAG: Phosphatidylcholine synthase, partial [uncultured Nocardioides sp.]
GEGYRLVGARVHRRRVGARAAHGALRLPQRRADRAVALPGRDVRGRHRRVHGPALPRQGGRARVRRRPPRQHRGLPDLRVRADGAAVGQRLPARRGVGRRGGLPAAGGLLLPVLPLRREDRRPLLPRLPQLLERRGVLRGGGGDVGLRHHGAAAGLHGAGVRAREVPLPLAHRGPVVPQHELLGRLAGCLRRHRGAAARPLDLAHRGVAGLPGLLHRGQPVADAAHRAHHAPRQLGRSSCRRGSQAV